MKNAAGVQARRWITMSSKCSYLKYSHPSHGSWSVRTPHTHRIWLSDHCFSQMFSSFPVPPHWGRFIPLKKKTLQKPSNKNWIYNPLQWRQPVHLQQHHPQGVHFRLFSDLSWIQRSIAEASHTSDGITGGIATTGWTQNSVVGLVVVNNVYTLNHSDRLI